MLNWDLLLVGIGEKGAGLKCVAKWSAAALLSSSLAALRLGSEFNPRHLVTSSFLHLLTPKLAGIEHICSPDHSSLPMTGLVLVHLPALPRPLTL